MITIPSISSLLDTQQFETALDFISAQNSTSFTELNDKLHSISNQISQNIYQNSIINSVSLDDFDVRNK